MSIIFHTRLCLTAHCNTAGECVAFLHSRTPPIRSATGSAPLSSRPSLIDSRHTRAHTHVRIVACLVQHIRSTSMHLGSISIRDRAMFRYLCQASIGEKTKSQRTKTSQRRCFATSIAPGVRSATHDFTRAANCDIESKLRETDRAIAGWLVAAQAPVRKTPYQSAIEVHEHAFGGGCVNL